MLAASANYLFLGLADVMENTLLVRYGKLLVCLAVIWVVFVIILPSLTRSSLAISQLANYIDESGIETGQFYYTGVEVVAHAEVNARSSIFISKIQKSKSKNE